jgi:hypothetical protein
MPVILDQADYARWLGEAPGEADELQALLRPFPAERMQAHEIGPRIGNVKNNDAALIERLAAIGRYHAPATTRQAPVPNRMIARTFPLVRI